MSTNALALSPASQLPARVTGRPGEWARDFAIVGGISALLAPLFAFSGPAFPVAAMFWGTLTGLAIGRLLPDVLERVRGRLPIPVLLTLGVPIGAFWGGITGFAAGLSLGSLELAVFGGLCASIAGAFQFGWLWFPYTFLTVIGRSRWPVVAASAVVAPALGWLAIFALMLVL